MDILPDIVLNHRIPVHETVIRKGKRHLIGLDIDISRNSGQKLYPLIFLADPVFDAEPFLFARHIGADEL